MSTYAYLQSVIEMSSSHKTFWGTIRKVKVIWVCNPTLSTKSQKPLFQLVQCKLLKVIRNVVIIWNYRWIIISEICQVVEIYEICIQRMDINIDRVSIKKTLNLGKSIAYIQYYGYSGYFYKLHFVLLQQCK